MVVGCHLIIHNMVQLYDASQRYPPSSIVQFNGGLYQTPVEIIHHEIPTNVLSSPWIYLATDALGRPTPQSQLHPPLFQSSLFQEDDDDDHEWGVIDAPEIFPRHPFPSEPSSSSREPSLSAHEAALEHQPNILLSEAAGEIVFKTAGKGLWSFSKEDPALEKLKEGVHRRVIGRDDVEGGRLAWLLSAQARKEYYSLPGAVCPEVRYVHVHVQTRVGLTLAFGSLDGSFWNRTSPSLKMRCLSEKNVKEMDRRCSSVVASTTDLFNSERYVPNERCVCVCV